MSIVIVIGPPGTGKTYNSERLRRHYKLKRIVEWEGRPVAIRDGDLILTCEKIKSIPGARVVAIEEALRAIGVHWRRQK